MRKWMLLLFMLLAVPAAAVVITPEVVIIDQNADLQAAIDALPAATGGEIRLAATTYTLSAPLVIDRPVRITGMGQYSTFIEMDNPDSNIVEITHSSVSLRDLCIGVALADTNAGDGIGVLIIGTTSTISDVILDKVRIQHTGSWGIKIAGQFASETPDISLTDIVSPVFNAVTVYNNLSGGAVFSGMGVSTPIFDNCNFVSRGWGSGGFWTAHPFYIYGTSEMQRGQVYIFGTTAALFRGCFFQLAGLATDTPVLTVENAHATRVDGCYFEMGSSNPRTNWMVTMSYAMGFVIRDSYVYSPADAGLHFLHTNSENESVCSGLIDGFYALHGDSSLADSSDVNDFVFNASGDAGQRSSIVLSNIRISNMLTGLHRDPSVTHETGGANPTAAFPAQNVLLLDAGRRIRVPMVASDTLSTLLDLKSGEVVYGKSGTGLTGGLGKLLLVSDNYSLTPIPTIPIVADTAAASALYGTTLPRREGDLCYTTGVHKLWVFTGTAWEAIH